MPRSARIVVPDYPYHITQRGNYKQNVFEHDIDRIKYLSWIKHYSNKYQLSLLAFCLMSNHVHFIAIPRKQDSLSKVFSIVHMRYSQYFNRKRNKSGHLWQGRFYSCVLDEGYLLAALKYVENNPVRGGIVQVPWEWEWSSAAYHVGKSKGLIQLDDIENETGIFIDNWQQYLESEESHQVIRRIREFTLLGRPLGTDEFISKIGARVGRALNVRSRGRPKKVRSNY